MPPPSPSPSPPSSLSAFRLRTLLVATTIIALAVVLLLISSSSSSSSSSSYSSEKKNSESATDIGVFQSGKRDNSQRSRSPKQDPSAALLSPEASCGAVVRAVHQAACSDVSLSTADRDWIASLGDSLSSEGVLASSHVCTLLLEGVQRKIADAALLTWTHEDVESEAANVNVASGGTANLRFVVVLDHGHVDNIHHLHASLATRLAPGWHVIIVDMRDATRYDAIVWLSRAAVVITTDMHAVLLFARPATPVIHLTCSSEAGEHAAQHAGPPSPVPNPNTNKASLLSAYYPLGNITGSVRCRNSSDDGAACLHASTQEGQKQHRTCHHHIHSEAILEEMTRILSPTTVVRDKGEANEIQPLNQEPQRLIHFVHLPKSGGSALGLIMKKVLGVVLMEGPMRALEGCTSVRDAEGGGIAPCASTLEDIKATPRCPLLIGCVASHAARLRYLDDAAFSSVVMLRDPAHRMLSGWYHGYPHTPKVTQSCGPAPSACIPFAEYLRAVSHSNLYTHTLKAASVYPYLAKTDATLAEYAQAHSTLSKFNLVLLQEAWVTSVHLLYAVLGWNSSQTTGSGTVSAEAALQYEPAVGDCDRRAGASELRLCRIGARKRADATYAAFVANATSDASVASELVRRHRLDTQLYAYGKAVFCTTLQRYPDIHRRRDVREELLRHSLCVSLLGGRE